MKRGPDFLDLVGEHRLVRSDNYLTTVSTSWMGSEGRPSARAGGEPTSQGCEAGLETRTHTGEAVPCHLLCMQVGKPGRPSGCFGRDGEYALNKATVSQLEANHVLTATLRWQSSECVSETFDRPMLYVWVVAVVPRCKA